MTDEERTTLQQERQLLVTLGLAWRCPRCLGTGKRFSMTKHHADHPIWPTPCDRCDGTGLVEKAKFDITDPEYKEPRT
jgi:DnaJ-class molecular chaperone